MTRSRFWMIVALVGCLGVVAIGWLFGVSPQLDARAAADDQRATVEAQNAVHSAKIIALKKQFDEMDTTRAELAGLRTQLPEGTEYADLTEDIASIAERHSVEIVQYTSDEAISPIALQEAIVVAAPVPEKAPDTTASPAAGAETGSDATAAALDEARSDGDAATAQAAATTTAGTTNVAAVSSALSPRLTASNLYAIPVSMSLKGTVADVLAMLEELQSSTRLFLVTETTVAKDESSTVKGYVFVVTGSEGAGAISGGTSTVETDTGETEPADANATVN